MTDKIVNEFFHLFSKEDRNKESKERYKKLYDVIKSIGGIPYTSKNQLNYSF